MSVVRKLFDGLTSFAANLGTDRDKSSTVFYHMAPFTDADALSAYECSAVARNIVDLPALDSCREWRDWQAEADQITAIEDIENRLGVRTKVLQARKWARLFGGSAIYIGTGDTNTAEELNLDRIGKDGIKYLTVISKDKLSAGEIEMDPSSEWYDKPKFYHLTANNGTLLDIHPSRLVIFIGNERPNVSIMPPDGYGSSVLASVIDAVKQADGTAANVASLVFEAKVDVIKVPDMMARMGDIRYEADLNRRFGLAAIMKGNNGMLLLDASEEYEQKNASFSTLPDIMATFMQIVSGASRIPATLLWGQAPSGMDATGDGDYKNYLDRIGSEQELYMTPAMHRLDECIIRSALGSRPSEIYYSWSPLWQQSEKEKAEIFKLKADAARVLVGSAAGQEIITREAVSVALTNAFIEDGSLPGLEAAIEDYGKIEEQEPSEEEIAAANTKFTAVNSGKLTGGNSGNGMAKDAAPRTLYVSRDVLNGDEIISWAKGQGFTSTLTADDMHVTIAFSRTPVDWMAVGSTWEDEVTIPAGGPRIMEVFGEGATVLLFKSNTLEWRHQEISEVGASWDHPEYQPHITISYGGAPSDLSKVEPYQGKIVLGPEIFKEVNEDWKAGIKET